MVCFAIGCCLLRNGWMIVFNCKGLVKISNYHCCFLYSNKFRATLVVAIKKFEIYTYKYALENMKDISIK